MNFDVFKNYECDNQMSLNDLEQWKFIDGFSEKFSVSNYGRVKSNQRYVSNHTGVIDKKDHILKQQKNKKGYLIVTILDGSKKKTMSVHRLVANAFIPNPDNKPQVNHIDCDKTNNYFGNLEWCTNSENQLHAVANGLNDHSKYESGRKKIPVEQIDKNTGEVICVFESIASASRETNTSSSNIRFCIYGKRHTANGFAWKGVM